MVLRLNIPENIVCMMDGEKGEDKLLINSSSLFLIVISYYTSIHASCTHSTGSEIFVIFRYTKYVPIHGMKYSLFLDK